MTAEVLRGAQAIESLADDWENLYGMGRCEPSTSLEWTRALLETHVADTDVVFSVVLRDRGQVVAIVPALIRRERLIGSLDVATLSFVSELHNTHSDILRSSDDPSIVSALFETFATLPFRWDVFRVSRLLDTSQLAADMVECLRRSGRKHRVRREQPSFFLELGATYEQYLRSRSAKLRNYLKRKTRQLGERGPVMVLRAGRDLALDEAYRDLLVVDEHSWKHPHGTAISAIGRQRSYYRSLCEGALQRGRLHLMLMYLEDRPIAYNLGLRQADRYSYIKTSFDEEFRSVSPATVLRARLVETLIAEDVRSLDFPAEPYQWEEQWTDQLRWHTSILLFNTTPNARLNRILVAARELLRRGRRDDNAVKYVDPRKLRVLAGPHGRTNGSLNPTT